MSLFCGIVPYHIDSFGEPFSVALKNELVKATLSTLTVCIHSINPEATKEDVVTSIRIFLHESIDDYDSFEKELIKHIPDVTPGEAFRYSVINVDPYFEEIPAPERIDYIKKGTRQNKSSNTKISVC